jgi:hypothetical protein
MIIAVTFFSLQPIAKGNCEIPSQHQSTCLRGPKSASMEIPPFRPHFITFSKMLTFRGMYSLLISKFGSERGDFK